MLTDQRFTDKDGKLIEVVTDPAGHAFIIGTHRGETIISVYFNDVLIREFTTRTDSAMKLSDAFKRAAYHGS